MLNVVVRRLAALSQPGVIALALAALAAVGVLDYLTGFELSFGVFYLVPVGVAAWYTSRPVGVSFAFAASVVWYVAERAGGYPFSHPVVPIWNAFVRLSFFLSIALLLGLLRERLRTEERLAKTDVLTGVLNRRAFLEHLDRDLALADRASGPLTLAYVDLDDFKRINDAHGHGEGDRLLGTVARTLVEATRRTDTVARLGGDEFALILPSTDLNGAEALIAKLRQLLNESLPRSARPVTCSIGAVVFLQRPGSADEAIAAADRLMYRAKTQGKNAAVFQVYSRSAAGSPEPVPDTPETMRRGAA